MTLLSNREAIDRAKERFAGWYETRHDASPEQVDEKCRELSWAYASAALTEKALYQILVYYSAALKGRA